MDKIDKIPYILRGEIFQIVSHDQNNNNVKVKCCECLNTYKGSIRSTGNFHMHIKRKHPHLLSQIDELRLASKVRKDYKKISSFKRVPRKNIKHKNTSNFVDNIYKQKIYKTNMDSADCKPNGQKQCKILHCLNPTKPVILTDIEQTSQQKSQQFNNKNNQEKIDNISTIAPNTSFFLAYGNRNSGDDVGVLSKKSTGENNTTGNDSANHRPTSGGTNTRNVSFENNLTMLLMRLDGTLLKIQNSLHQIETTFTLRNYLEYFKYMQWLISNNNC